MTMTGRRWLVVLGILGSAILPRVASAAEIVGKWVAEVSSPTMLEPAYERVTLERTGDTLSGQWGRDTVKGTVSGSNVTITLSDAQGRDAGSITGKIAGDAVEGSGTMAGMGRRGGG